MENTDIDVKKIPPLSPESTSRSLAEHFGGNRKDEKVIMKWSQLNYSTLEKDPSRSKFCAPVFKEKHILKNSSGAVENGQLLAIMGPTGCGKTSLLNILAARVSRAQSNLMKLTGSIEINGVKRDEEYFRKISAYVLQDDFMYPHLTVQETFTLSANFFLPADTTVEKRQIITDAVINELGLAKARDTIIGDEKVRGVSGGERRRASIGTQLLVDPKVLFLDEPTSGLDSFQALSVMEAMKSLAENGRMVISVIHQPRSSIFNMFDRLLLLSEGKAMFFGVASDAVGHFASKGHKCPELFNPSDYFLDILSPDNRSEEQEQESRNRIKYLGDQWAVDQEIYFSSKALTSDTSNMADIKSIKAIGNESIDVRRYIRNWLSLAWRAWAEQSRDVATIGIKLMFTCFFALVIGGIYNHLGNSQKSIQNRNGLLFFIILNQAFNSVLGVLNTFPKEKNIVNRERSGRAYDTFAYFAAKVLVEIPLNVLPSLVYSCIVYWMVELNDAPGRFGAFVLILFLENFVAIALGLAVSSAVDSVEAANALGPPLLIIAILFGGFYINIKSLPIVANWIPYFSVFRWSYEALCINEYKGLTFVCDGGIPSYACVYRGEQALINLSFNGHTTRYPVFGLGMLLLGFLSVAYFNLYRSKMEYLNLGHVGQKYDKAGKSTGAGAEAAPLVDEVPTAQV